MEMNTVALAYGFFEMFEGLFADQALNYALCSFSRPFFISKTTEEAFSIAKIELNLPYEVLYTKIVAIQLSLGYTLRFASLLLFLIALAAFSLTSKQGVEGRDVALTYLLLGGGVALEIGSFLVLIFCSWTAVKIARSRDLQSHSQTTTPFRRLFDFYTSCIERLRSDGPVDRWPISINSFNLIRYCSHPPPEMIEKYLGLRVLAKATNMLYVKEVPNVKRNRRDLISDEVRNFIYDEVRNFIYSELKEKSNLADNFETQKQICLAKGDSILRSLRCDFLLHHVEYDYDENLIIWHIATELFYNAHRATLSARHPERRNKHRRVAKILSDYMLYILILQPAMMPSVAQSGSARFRYACAELKKLFKANKIGKWDRKRKPEKVEQVRACRSIVEAYQREASEGRSDKSLVSAGWMLFTELEILEERPQTYRHRLPQGPESSEQKWPDKWKIISKVWVELLCYAASDCGAYAHAGQQGKGQELITVVWLLMAHLGMGEQFQKDGLTQEDLIKCWKSGSEK